MSRREKTLIAKGPRTAVYVRGAGDDRVVLKVLADEHPSPDELVRFYNDLEMTRELAVDGVRRGLRRTREDGRYALVMEYAPGEPMGRQIVHTESQLTEFLDVAIRIASILGEVHARGVIHRDVKPENVIYDASSRQVALIDFGLASRIALGEPQLATPEGIEGTLAYISPEQTGRMNRAVDHRTDLYSLGATYYQLLTGRPPFLADDPMELVHCHLAVRPAPPHAHNPAVPPIVSEIVLKLLGKNADARYQSAYGVAHDLERCRASLIANHPARTIGSFPLGERDASGRFQLPQRLYGRDDDRAALLAAVRSVSAGAVELVMVTGYSGVGKSALVHEAHRPIAEARGYFIRGNFDPLHRNIPYSALIQAFGELSRFLLTEGDDKLADWRARILAAVGELGGVLTALIPDLVHVIGDQPEVPELAGDQAQNRLRYVVRSFLGAVCTAEHPLALFLDDLQWADLASLELLSAVVTSSEIRHLLVIGAYRDNEVSAAHPLAATLESMRTAGAWIRELPLGNLTADDVGGLVSEALGASRSRVSGLTELLMAKTEGNAFAVVQFLRTLYQRGGLVFDAATRRWTWDDDQIRALSIPDNVVDLMTERIRELPAPTRRALQLAACVGGRFGLGALAVIEDRTPREVARELWPAVTERLIVPLGNAYRLVGPDADDDDDDHDHVGPGAGHATGEYDAADDDADAAYERARFAFVHDRVQHAAYRLADKRERAVLHREIGRHWLSRSAREPDDRDGELFDIVNQLDLAVDIIDDPDERLELAELNLEAGRRARRAAAYAQALGYFETGIALLPDDAWSAHYDLALALRSEAAQSAYPTGAFDVVERHAGAVIDNARRVTDALDAHDSVLRSAASRDELDQVVDHGLRVLAELGVSFPRRPNMGHVAAALIRTKIALLGKSIDTLDKGPEMTDPTMRAAMYIIERMVPSAFRSGSKLFPLLIFKLVNLSLKHGNMPVSFFGYGGYAITLCGVLGDVDTGYRVGKLGIRLAERFDEAQRVGDAMFVFDNFVRHWHEPLRASADDLLTAHHRALAAGRLFEGVWAACYRLVWMFASGAELSRVWTELETYRDVLRGDEGARSMGELLRQVVANLRGAVEPVHRLAGEHYDEDAMRARYESSPDKTEVAFFHTFKLMLCVLSGEREEALVHAERAESFREALTAMPLDPILWFYAALARLAAYRDDGSRSDLLRAAGKARGKLRKWARSAPQNYLHKHLLLEAEYARATGKHDDARELYERAMLAARESEYRHEEALTLELAGGFYHGREHSILADTFSVQAARAYEHWGAKAAARRLVGDLPEAARSATSAERWTRHHTTTGPIMNLDMTSVMKASTALSAEIVMERLLERLIQIVVENAGADHGALLLRRGERERRAGQHRGRDGAGSGEVADDALEVHAEFSTGDGASGARAGADGRQDDDRAGGQVAVMQAIPLSQATGLCESLVRYVARTGATRVVNDARDDPQLARDPYVREGGARSMLAMPILHQGKLTGVLYLENRLTAGAFTPGRIETLRVLSSQAAISLENARLYGRLDHALKQQVALAEAQRRFVPREFLDSLGRTSIVEVELGDSVQKEMSILFSDIRKFTTLVEGMTSEDNIGFINSYLAHMEPCILGHGGFIDSYIGDAVMALFEGSPDRAVAAAVEMLGALAAFNRERGRAGRQPIEIGIGINTGLLTLGTIGGANRLKCGVIGDSVNLASRVESLTKEYAPILISDRSYSRLRDPSAFSIRPVDRVRVVGRVEPATLYEVFDADPEPQKRGKLAIADDYARALEHYYAREFADARALLGRCQERFRDAVAAVAAGAGADVPDAPHAPDARDPIVAMFLDRCERSLTHPVDDSWTGVEDMKHK